MRSCGMTRPSSTPGTRLLRSTRNTIAFMHEAAVSESWSLRARLRPSTSLLLIAFRMSKSLSLSSHQRRKKLRMRMRPHHATSLKQPPKDSQHSLYRLSWDLYKMKASRSFSCRGTMLAITPACLRASSKHSRTGVLRSKQVLYVQGIRVPIHGKPMHCELKPTNESQRPREANSALDPGLRHYSFAHPMVC